MGLLRVVVTLYTNDKTRGRISEDKVEYSYMYPDEYLHEVGYLTISLIGKTS